MARGRRASANQFVRCVGCGEYTTSSKYCNGCQQKRTDKVEVIRKVKRKEPEAGE